MSRQGGDAPGESYELVAEATGSLEGITELHWGFREEVPFLVVEVTVDFGTENDCEVLSADSSYIDGPGPRSLDLYERGDSVGWGMSSSGSGYASVHAGDVDTRDVLGASGNGGGASWTSGTFDGTLVFTSLVRHPQPYEENPFLEEEYSFALSITCEKPFSVARARTGGTGLMANADNLDGGAGAEVFLVGSANAQDQASLEFVAPEVRAMSDGFGYHAGQVVLDHPDGQAAWTYTPLTLGAQGVLAGGPGTYTFTVDQAGAYIDVLWAAAWGLDGELDLAAGLLPASVIDSPFD